ncbi:pirin family protein [Rudanella paleaurantiibacter]|uniref:Pirin family protein n=1 Tax=Rudanella paleaurantiibacter TaxID=2614655 RepID=A0A7J5TY14_9BACT|nr:pirin family protein [Rudanella paleaurantiibacter]KAB7729955.1 pirin family protein [Rudanella paleaurantiibacter]
MRTIKRVHRAEYRPIADLITYSPLPTRQLAQIDPFLFLNHHGYQTYPPHNHGLPFGPHPHRGMETVTFIVEGDIMHKDSQGYQSVITAGGVQWMTAGRGLIHAEVSSDTFRREGGPLEILQLWVNLPARFKMTEPAYTGLQRDDIPGVSPAEGVQIRLVSGNWVGQSGAFSTLTDVFLATVELKAGTAVTLPVDASRNILFYLIRGMLTVNGQAVTQRELVEFNRDGESLDITATTDALLLFGHAQPFDEPVVANGPFVMNTEEEIRQAYTDYRMGKFGIWNE